MEVKPGYKQTEVGVIPEEWEMKSLADIGHIKTGPFGTLLKADEYYANEGDPLVSVRDIGEGVLTFDEHTPLVPPSVVRRLPEYVLNCGDIVLGRKGGVDRSAIVQEGQAGCFLGSDGIRIRPSKACHAPFVAYQLQRKEIQAWLLQNATGTTMASMNQEILRRVSLPFPSLPEQRAIAAALGDVDALLGALTHLIAKKRDLKQAAMQQLLTGHRRLTGFSGEWDISTVGREFEIQLGKMLDSAKNSGVRKPYLGNKAVQWNRIDINDLPTVAMSCADLARYRLQRGDLLVCEGGEVGRAAIWEAPIAECYYQKALHRLRPLRGFSSRLMVDLLRYWADHGLLANYVSQTSIAHLTREKLVDVLMPIPQPEEQTAIAAVLSDMDAELAALKQRQVKTRALKQGMMQELLTGRTRLV